MLRAHLRMVMRKLLCASNGNRRARTKGNQEWRTSQGQQAIFTCKHSSRTATWHLLDRHLLSSGKRQRERTWGALGGPSELAAEAVHMLSPLKQYHGKVQYQRDHSRRAHSSPYGRKGRNNQSLLSAPTSLLFVSLSTLGKAMERKGPSIVVELVGVAG